jgi:glycosyltransferase involved in cell wall biosynthesis
MFTRKLYYALKPYLPWSLRMALRRVSAKAKRKSSRDVWPIKESAGRPPAGWSGWPGGKKFALVLTHDVESQRGLDKCRALAEFEKREGFRSSFNFIPEGPYEAPDDLRAELTKDGFEIGVHDLAHDGRLFGSHDAFKAKALRINHYLHKWHAKGFRSGFMLRNLDWIHRLDLRYDLSTFDTDPFEFQPNGVDTIFPFWIGTPNASPAAHILGNPGVGVTAFPFGGYVELPYTLAQDSTLFLVLQETTPALWLEKLDWIAAKGGMALVNVHPDYINFSEGPNHKTEYRLEMYAELLRYISRKYAGEFWHPLPSQLAEWHTMKTPTQAPLSGGSSAVNSEARSEPEVFAGLRGKQVAVLLYSTYPSDPRPRRAAEALAQLGASVEVICLKEDDKDPVEEVVNDVRIRRLPIKHRRGGKLAYLWQYASFLLSSFFILGWRSLRKRYQLVHVHNMPDVLVFSALIPKLRGAKIILDLHDPMPELMMTIFGSTPESSGTKLLRWLEKLSIGVSDTVLTVNETCKKIFAARSCRAEKVSVVMNAPDEEIFQYREASAGAVKPRDPAKKFVIMYHGSLVDRHGLDLAVVALDNILSAIPNAELHVYGKRTPYLDKVLDSVRGTAVGEAVRYFGAKNLTEIVKAIGACDVGVIPNRRSIFTEINTPTRIFEYLSQGKPVIAPRAPGILDYFGPDDLIYFELGSVEDLTKKFAYAYRSPAEVAASVLRGQAIYQNHTWRRERGHLLNVFARTLGVAKSQTANPTAVTRARE